MSRRASKGKGKWLPTSEPSSSSDNEASDSIQDQIAPSKKPRISSPERIHTRALARMGNTAPSSSKGMAGFASLVNRSNLNAAKSETNRGLKGSISGRSSRTGTSSKAAIKPDIEGILVGGIVFLVVGIMENPTEDIDDCSTFQPLYCLQSNVNTDSASLTGMKQAGLHVMHATGFEFLSTDTYSIIDTKLWSLFPKLFEWFVTLEDSTGGIDTSSSWLICMKPPYKKQISVYSDDKQLPTGFDIMRACGMSKRKVGVQDHTLYLVTRYPVPANVVQSWRPKASIPCKITAAGSIQVLDTFPDISGDSDESASSGDESRPLSSLFSLCRRRQDLQEESEAEREIVDILDDSTNSEVPPPAEQESAYDAGPATPPNIVEINDTFSSSMYFGGDGNPWN